VCKHSDWCGVSADGILAICMRVESARTSRNGGWVHRLRDTPPAYRPPPVIHRPAPAPTFDLMLAKWQAATTPEAVQRLAGLLGVEPDSLDALGVAWAPSYSAWAFPMLDADGEISGIRLRSEAGEKWAVRGSHEGLFYTEARLPDALAWICEGPTDTAAALTLGLWAIGRPSCTGAVRMVRDLLARLRIRRAIIVADVDDPKHRPSGGHWRPGAEGAARLGPALGVPFKIIFPPRKDLREWVKCKPSKSEIETIAAAFPWQGVGYGR